MEQPHDLPTNLPHPRAAVRPRAVQQDRLRQGDEMNHLCTPCKRLMCPDCITRADDYEQQLRTWKQKYAQLQWEYDKLRQQVEALERVEVKA